MARERRAHARVRPELVSPPGTELPGASSRVRRARGRRANARDDRCAHRGDDGGRRARGSDAAEGTVGRKCTRAVTVVFSRLRPAVVNCLNRFGSRRGRGVADGHERADSARGEVAREVMTPCRNDKYFSPIQDATWGSRRRRFEAHSLSNAGSGTRSLDRMRVSPRPGLAEVANQSTSSSELLDASHSPTCLLYTSPSPRDISGSRMPSSA